MADIDQLLDTCDSILGRAFCALGDGATSPVTSSVKLFREEYERHVTEGRLPVRPRQVLCASSTILRRDPAAEEAHA